MKLQSLDALVSEKSSLILSFHVSVKSKRLRMLNVNSIWDPNWFRGPAGGPGWPQLLQSWFCQEHLRDRVFHALQRRHLGPTPLQDRTAFNSRIPTRRRGETRLCPWVSSPKEVSMPKDSSISLQINVLPLPLKIYLLPIFIRVLPGGLQICHFCVSIRIVLANATANYSKRRI